MIVYLLTVDNSTNTTTTQAVGAIPNWGVACLINYFGPADPYDPTSTLMSIYGTVQGVAPAPGNLPANLNFFLYVETALGMESVEVGKRGLVGSGTDEGV